MPRITSEDFGEWLENPVTEYFRQYLVDSRKEVSELLAEEIASGNTIPVEAQIETTTLCLALEEMSELDFDTIESFYDKGE